MAWLKNHAASARVVAVMVLGGLAVTGCATNQYVDEKIAMVNSRIDQVDSRVQAASQRADSGIAAANAAAQSAANDARSANAAAQAAATDARTANQRIDQLTGRVETLEKGPVKKPRG